MLSHRTAASQLVTVGSGCRSGDVTIGGQQGTRWQLDDDEGCLDGGGWAAGGADRGELRATLSGDGDLLASLGRVVEVTRSVVGVDGSGLTLAHEDGRPRWVAVSDAAMELSEQVQGELGEGPCLAAFAEDRVVAVEDLQAGLGWDRIAVVVRPLGVRGVLSVPVRLADLPVGTLDVYVSQPRVWTAGEVQALAALAVVTAELVRAHIAACCARRRPR